MNLTLTGWAWNLTADEHSQVRPASLARSGRALRGVDVAAPAEVVWRWLRQLKVAPYSYDWIDNGFARSPRALTPGLSEFAVGDQVMSIFTVVEVEPQRRVRLRLTAARARRVFGDLTVEYRVTATVGGARLIGLIEFGPARTRRRLLASHALAFGDLVMMRKQLLTLASRAEAAPRPVVAWTLGGIVALHTAFGLLNHGSLLADAVRDGWVGAFTGERQPLFWFLMMGFALIPTLPLCARLERQRRLPTSFGLLLILFGVLGVSVWPASGFWTAIGAGALSVWRSQKA